MLITTSLSESLIRSATCVHVREGFLMWCAGWRLFVVGHITARCTADGVSDVKMRDSSTGFPSFDAGICDLFRALGKVWVDVL